ncbi:MAG: DUF948 domain-containing protein [Coriobacteriales bacterium]|nr:DUF948 domain-containing protein [Coriobacteriales bacterium]
MNILRIVLEVLIVVGIWALVELALTIRKTRASVDEITKQVSDVATSANDTIEQVQPVVAKVDGIVTDLEPAAKRVDPLLEKAETTLDVATVDLASINDILVDVSSVTDTASNVTSTVSKATNSAVSGVAGVVGKFTGRGKRSHHHHKLADRSTREEASQIDAAKAEEPHDVPEASIPSPASEPQEQAYVTYDSARRSE